MDRAKVVIIGSGPAGLTAAIYAARASLEPILFEGFYSGPSGGQLMTTTDVENYPGFPDGVMGPELMLMFRKQAERFGTTFFLEDVDSVEVDDNLLTVKSSKRTIQAHSVIVATGATAKRLDIPGAGEGEFWQKGVTACAVCDGAMPIFRDKDLYVIGGGDTAMEEALFLTKYASKVYIVHRRDQLRASKIMGERVLNHPKIEVLWDSVVSKISGNQLVESVTIHNVKTKQEVNQPAGGVFFAVGHIPNNQFLGSEVERDSSGYVVVEPGKTGTNIPGLYAAGDIQDPYFRQAITAAGSGCQAALEAERYLTAKGI